MKVEELKSKILQLAIQGKLVEQNPEDTPASVLLEEITKEKEKLTKEKKIKKENPLSEITDEEKVFVVPNGWEWCRLNDICKLITDGTHSTPKYIDNGIPFISVKDITKGIIDFSDTRFISREEHEILIKRCNPEFRDVLLTKVGTTGIAKVIDTTKEFSIFVSIALLKLFNNQIDENYIELLINSPFVKKQSEENTQGVGNKNLVIRCIKNFIIPLPPLKEQKRIVDKVNELFTIIDELNENKDVMLKNISDTRNKVLQLAIQGKLVEQCEGDEPVEVLLQRIAEEKEKLIKEKKIKKEKPLSEVTEEEKPFDIPNEWKWVRLSGIIKVASGKNFNSIDFFDEGEGNKTIKITNVGVGEFVKTEGELLPINYSEEYLDYVVSTNDILIALTRPFIKDGLKVCRCPIEYNGALLNQRVAELKDIYSDRQLEDYIYMYLSSLYILEFIKESCNTSLQPNLSVNTLSNLTVPLPPLEEQKRIVAKVDEIMNYLDELEKTILEQDII